ncbi:hypothetical protein ACQPVA_00250 [Clostridium butyricum]|uniref:hypothetical protein n=1 Tax=Clostridium butyricum TaxID=1492 RepID=UPI003D34FB14
MDDNIIRDYKEAVHEISKAYYFINNDESDAVYGQDVYNKSIKQYPYFFIAGAGISSESVKTSAQITAECKRICKENQYNRSRNVEEQYSYWLEKAFPHKETRKRYIKNLIKDKRIPESAIKLANILLSRKVSNLVVTPNFDTFIYDTLKLFGENNIIISDTCKSAGKLNIESNSLNILHVYGTYEFYDCVSQKYTNERNKDLDELFSVRSFLRTALNGMSPLVIGYSGWENDVIMSELKERFKMPLKYKMYWFCHNEEDYKNLPLWIKYSDEEKKIVRDDVIFVLPKEERVYGFEIDDDLKYSDFNDVLDSGEVLSSFISEFNIKSPDIIQNPIRFLKKYFEENFSKNIYSDFLLLRFNESGNDKEIQAIKEAIISKDIVEIINKTENFANNLDAHGEENVRILLNYLVTTIEQHTVAGLEKGNLKKVINLYKKLYKYMEKSSVDKDKLDLIKVRLEEILTLDNYSVIKGEIDSILNIMNTISESSEGYKDVYRKCINIKLSHSEEDSDDLYNSIIDKIQKWDEPEDRKLLIKMYMEKAIFLEEDDDMEGSVAMLENAEKYFPYVKDDEWLENVFILCRLRKAELYNDLEEYDKALTEIDAVKNRYYDREDLKLKQFLADTMILKGSILKKNMRLEEAEESFDEIYSKYSMDKDENIRRKAVKALINKAEVLEMDEDFYEAIEVYNDIINRYKDDNDDELRRAAAQARLNKLVILTKNEKDEVIVRKCNEILNIYKDENDEKIKLVCLQVTLCKAIGLHNSGKQKEAMELYNDIIKARKEDADIKMKSLIMEARIFKSYCLKDNTETLDTKEMCNEIITLCKSDEGKKAKTKVVETMLNQADSLIKSGDVDEGIKIYNEIEITYKDNAKIIGTIREFIQSIAKYSFDSAKLIYEQLKYNCINSSYEVEDEVLLAGFSILINNKDADFNLIEDNAIGLSRRNDNIKKEIEAIVGNIGTDAYMNKNFNMAEKYYYLLYRLNNNMCLNIAYMIRRKEVKNANIYPDCEALIESAAVKGSDMANINKALLLADKEMYDDAVACIRKINNTASFEWWKHMDDGESEKYKVLFMGLITGRISESELNINDVIEKLEGFHENDFILHIERVIYLEK